MTLTGIDAKTDISRLLQLPDWVEFGVLYTAKPEGRNRYPVMEHVSRILTGLQGRRSSLHVCGAGARLQLLQRELESLTAMVDRIQVNGIMKPLLVEELCQQFPEHILITQHCPKNAELLQVRAPNHAVLVDGSGGRGIVPRDWFTPITLKPVGFAGGLSAATLPVELPKLAKSLCVAGSWVDMESGLRDEHDWFDVLRAAAAVEICSRWRVDGPA